jgi:hypothetical protein
MGVKRNLLFVTVMGLQFTIAPWTLAASDRPQPSTTDRVVRDTKEAVEATKQYTIQQKETFQKAVRSELIDLQARIVELQQKTNAVSAEARSEMQKALKELEGKKDGAKKELEEITESTSATWSRLKNGMNAALVDIRKSYKETVTKLP